MSPLKHVSLSQHKFGEERRGAPQSAGVHCHCAASKGKAATSLLLARSFLWSESRFQAIHLQPSCWREGEAFLHDSVVVVAAKVYIHSVPQQHPVQTFVLAKASLVLVWMQSLRPDPHRRWVPVEPLRPCSLAVWGFASTQGGPDGATLHGAAVRWAQSSHGGALWSSVTVRR